MIDVLAQRWRRALDAARARSRDQMTGAARVQFGVPASEEELAATERVLGRPIPPSVTALFRVAKMVDVWWDLGNEDPPKPFDQIFAGQCTWDLDQLGNLIDGYDGWVREVFPNADDPYDKVWHQKFPVMEVGNGDLIAVDLDGRPTYLSHDDGEGHGYILGRDAVDFVDRWSRLGCPGPEDWQWLPFTTARDSFLQPDGEPARAWRAWFGLADDPDPRDIPRR